MLELVAKGLTNREIGNVLGIAAATVKRHVEAVIGALDVTNRTEAAVALQELGTTAVSDHQRVPAPRRSGGSQSGTSAALSERATSSKGARAPREIASASTWP